MAQSNDEPVYTPLSLYPDISDIEKIAATAYYVDKTMFINTLFKFYPDKNLIITTPHGFGKTTNLKMLKKFLEIQIDPENGEIINKSHSTNLQFFQKHKFNICIDENFFAENFASRPVIYISFRSVTGDSFEEILNKFRTLFKQTFTQHRYLLNKLNDPRVYKRYADHSDSLALKDIEKGLKILSELVFEYFNNTKLVVLIDDYDRPLNSSMFKNEVNIEELFSLIEEILRNVSQCGDVFKVLISGIVQYQITLNRKLFVRIRFLDDSHLVEYYGLTDVELSTLLDKFHVTDVKQDILKHYSHYMSLSSIKMFSTFSILKYLETRVIQNYHISDEFVDNLFQRTNGLTKNSTIELLLKWKTFTLGRFIPIDSEEFQLMRNTSNLITTETRGFIHPVECNAEGYFQLILFQLGFFTNFESNGMIRIVNYQTFVEVIKQVFYLTYPSNSEIYQHINECVNLVNQFDINHRDKHNLYKQFINSLRLISDDLKLKLFLNCKRYFYLVLVKIFLQSNFIICDLYTNDFNLVCVKNDLAVFIRIVCHQTLDVALTEIWNQRDTYRIDFVKQKIFIGFNLSIETPCTMRICEQNINTNCTSVF